MAHQNIQFIKILHAKIIQGKNKTFMHNERFMHTILSKNPTQYSDVSRIGYGYLTREALLIRELRPSLSGNIGQLEIVL